MAISVQASCRPVGKAIAGSQFARARAQRPQPKVTVANYCAPSSAGGYRNKYASKQQCAPCDPMDPFGIGPMLSTIANMSASVECGPSGSVSGFSVPRGIPVDIIEKTGSFTIMADIPGVKKDQIKLIVDDRVLTIEVDTSTKTKASEEKEEAEPIVPKAKSVSSDKPSPKEDKVSDEEEEESDELNQWIERPKSFARRTLRLPKSADLGAVTATYEDGVLQLVVAKREESRQQRISIA